jgi:hypothetical protein
MHFVTFASLAQNQNLIRGVIKNEFTQLPIEGVNIQLNNTNTGTTSNKQGVFELRVNEFPALLTITHISYLEKQVAISKIQDDPIIIWLNKKTIMLSEAEITSGTYEIFKGKGQEIIDYNFLDTNLLILSYNYNNNHHELILTDESFDTIHIKDISHLKKPKQIFKDCMGNCHLLTGDSAYQVYFHNESIQLIYPTHLPKFLKFLGNCLFETPTHLAFEANTDKRPKLEYAAIGIYDFPNTRSKNEQWKHLFYLMNKKTHEKTILDNVYEWEKNHNAFDHAMFVFDPNNPHSMFFGDLLRFEETSIYKPSFQTVKFLNDTIYYFNHMKSQIDIYSYDLIFVDSIKVEYNYLNNWVPIIITDLIENKAFTIFTTGVMYSLAEINLADGSTKEVTKIKKLFPQKIKINNGHLYFLYKDLTNSMDKRKLFQGKLANF